MKPVVREYARWGCYVVSLTLLVVTANLTSPPGWLMLPAWALLGIAIVMRMPKEVAGAGVIFLLVFGMFKSSFEPTAQMLHQPSLDHIIGFMTTKAFLVSVGGYFALLAASYSEKLRDAERQIEARERELTYVAENAKK